MSDKALDLCWLAIFEGYFVGHHLPKDHAEAVDIGWEAYVLLTTKDFWCHPLVSPDPGLVDPIFLLFVYLT